MASGRLGTEARRDLLDARDEHRYWMHRWRSEKRCRSGTGCDDDACLELEECREEAYHGLLRVVWACVKGRGAPVPEVAGALGVEPRSVERYLTEYRRRLAKH